MKNKSEVRNKIFHITLATCVKFSFLESTQLSYASITFFVMTIFWSPPKGGHLYMKVKCSCAFVRSYYDGLVNLTLFLCYTAYAKRACGWLLKSKNAWVR